MSWDRTADASTSSDRGSELVEAIMRVARSIRRSSSAELAPLGLTMGQARLLRQLAKTGPLRMAEIAAWMDVVPRSATDMVDGLQHLGFVDRRPDPADRRSVLVEVTPTGQELIQRMALARQRAASRVFGQLSAAEQAQLLDLLHTVPSWGEHRGCPKHKDGKDQ